MLASPFIIYQLWLFIAPGLYTHEKKFAVPFVLFCTMLLRARRDVLALRRVSAGRGNSSSAGRPTTWSSGRRSARRSALRENAARRSALIFQMPTVVFFLARMGMVTAGFLARNTKYAILIIFIIAAVISPDTDVVSQTLMAGPMLGAVRHQHPGRLGRWPPKPRNFAA